MKDYRFRDNHNCPIGDTICYVEPKHLKMRYDMAQKSFNENKDKSFQAAKGWCFIARLEMRYIKIYYPEYLI